MKNRFFIAIIAGGSILLSLCLSGGTAQLSTKGTPLNPAQPVPHRKTGVKTPSSRQPRHLHPKNSIKTLPDLIVGKIWLDKRGVVFRIKNTGKGTIPVREHQRGRVVVTCGGKKQTYAFTRKVDGNPALDPKGVLKSPGGTITCATGINPGPSTHSHSITVTILVDSTKKIREQNEGNNAKTSRLPVLLKTVASKTQDKKNLKTGRPSAFTNAAFGRMGISVEKIYLHHGTVHVLLKNHGKTDIAAGKFRLITLHLSAGAKIRTWHLAVIDREGRLRHSGSSFDFDTGIMLSRAQRVMVSLKGMTSLKKSARAVFSKHLTPSRKNEAKLRNNNFLKTGNAKHPRKLPVTPAAPHPIGSLGNPAENLHQAPVPPRELLSVDIKILNYSQGNPRVKYDHHRNRIWIYYDCDPEKYRGPVKFHITVRVPYSQELVLDKTWVDAESADLMASVAFNWEDAFPHSYKPLKLRYEITVNSDRKILETNYENNQRFGFLYHGGSPFISRMSSPFFPELRDPSSLPQKVIRTRAWVHNSFKSGGCWFYDPYDPDVNMLMVEVTADISNPSDSDRTVHVIFSCDSMDGATRYAEDVPVEAGGWKKVTKLIGINMQDKNYILIQMGGHVYLNLGIEFRELPYDPTASFRALYVSPNQRLISASTGGTCTFSVGGGDAPWHITTDDPAYSPVPDTLVDNGNAVFSVTVPAHATPKMVTYIITDALNHTVATRLFIMPSQ